MNQNIEAFLNKMDSDPELAAKVWTASEVEDLVRLARDEGFLFEVEDLVRAASWSDDELDAVSGGSLVSQGGITERLHELVADEQNHHALNQPKTELRRRVAELLGRLGKS